MFRHSLWKKKAAITWQVVMMVLLLMMVVVGTERQIVRSSGKMNSRWKTGVMMMMWMRSGHVIGRRSQRGSYSYNHIKAENEKRNEAGEKVRMK